MIKKGTIQFQNYFDPIVTFFGLLLGESQRFMDAVVARDEENMTAPESQPYHMHSVSCYFGIQF